jgi:trimeric autotransporter adhesin
MRSATPARFVCALILSLAWVGSEYAQATIPLSPGEGGPAHAGHYRAQCTVEGIVTSASTPLPGVAIFASTPDTRDLATTSTEPNGVYRLVVPAAATYAVRAELPAFAPASHDVTLDAANCSARLDFSLTLASRAPTPAPAATGSPQGTPAASASSPARAAAPGGRAPAAAAGRGRGFQQLDVVANAAAGESTQTADEAAEALRAELQLPPGFSANAPTETVATAGNQGQSNESLLFGGRGGREGGPEGFERFGGGNPGEGDGAAGQGPGGGFGGGRGGGPGGFGGPGGPLGGMRGGGRLQGNANYTLGGSMFDASPYALNGRARQKPEYVQQHYGGALGGPLHIPHVFNGGTRTSFFVNYSGNRSRNPVDSYSTVPTLAERTGDFSASSSTIIDPSTGLPFSGNRIPQEQIASSARALLPYIPAPNILGDTQNFHYATAVTSSSDDVNVRVTHVFGARPQRGGRGGRGGGPAGGGRGGGGFGPGGRGPGGGRGPAQPRSVLNVSVSVRTSDAAQSSAFPTVGGSTSGTGVNVPGTYMYAKGRFNNVLNVSYNRNASRTSNLYAFTNDVAGAAGIGGVSTDPFDWGIPDLSFTTVADIRDRTPSKRIDQRIQIGDTMMRTWRTHALRFGGDYRTIRIDSLSNSDPRGSFVFTGLYTSDVVNGRPAAGTGLDFADFLLGYAQQATVQYGPGTIKLRGRTWNLFLQDDWRVRNNLTINYGLRYEYVSPFVEADDRLVNLDVNGDFTAAVPVVSGSAGPYSGELPSSLVKPDRNNVAPRIGLAWKPQTRTTIRTGYGVNYNLGVYGTIAQKLAGQPPFAVTATGLGTAIVPLPLTNAFGSVDPSETTNSYGIDAAYQLGMAQIWNVDVQRELPRNLTVNAGYTGTRGSDLDIQRAPNRNPDGTLRISGVQPFLWESSEGHSTLHALSLRARKRLARGVAFGGAYTWSRAYDNASSIGGGGATVAQNDRDLEAEWGRSSFERRHSVTADYSIELPWGRGRRWLDAAGWKTAIFGGWSWTGNVTAQSGGPFTPRVTGSFRDVATGVNGTLRADYNGQPVAVSDPTVQRFFNTAAFGIPAAGLFGTAARNMITGPDFSNTNMSLSKNVTFARSRGMSIRVQANNVFNSVQFSTIDTVVNSPTFGQIIGVRPMRSVQLIMRFRF